MTSADDHELELILDAHFAGEEGASAALIEWADKRFREHFRPAIERRFKGHVGADSSVRYTQVFNDFLLATLEGRRDRAWRHRSTKAIRGAVFMALNGAMINALSRRRARGDAECRYAMEKLADERVDYMSARYGLEFEAVSRILDQWVKEGSDQDRLMARVFRARCVVGETYEEIAKAEGIEDRSELHRVRDRAVAALRARLHGAGQ